MDAIVLEGGQGSRLRPLTAHRHKSLVPVLNRPALEYLFDWLERHGIARAVLALGQANEDLAATYPPGRRGSLELLPVFEKERLESGGAIRHAAQHAGISGRFLVLNGDVFVDFDLTAAITAHSAAKADLTLALHEEPDPSSFGVAVLDGGGFVVGFIEKPPPGEAPSNLVNAGVWIFEPGLVDEIPPGAVRVEETLFPSLVARGRRVLGFPFKRVWADLGTPARYLALNGALLRGENAVADGCTIATSASLSGVSLGQGTVIEADARILDSILWEGVNVGQGAVIERSVVADGVRIEPGARVSGAVVGRGASIAARAVVPPGTSIETDARYDEAYG
ncbi:MAG TPA: NDP-sugar synthase [Tepidiformaceae bacterium]|nr:NDP-sugar synthase [Tepidiformaceae bacterium]